jgi:hypothetical protein
MSSSNYVTVTITSPTDVSDNYISKEDLETLSHSENIYVAQKVDGNASTSAGSASGVGSAGSANASNASTCAKGADNGVCAAPSTGVNGVPPSICLGMIVKNESRIILDTLKQLTSYINFGYWVINDNGSTDGTQDIIRNFFKEKGIPGELDETKWKDFGYNRTVVFDRAYNKTDYIFIWDADDEIKGDFVFPRDELLVYDSYSFQFGSDSGFRWSRYQLFNNHLHWRYVGVLHEYPECCEVPKKILSSHTVKGDYYFVGRTIGSRNDDRDKYKKDAILLEKAFNDAYEKGEDICNRYAFYTAQSYRDCGMNEKAIEFYKKVLTLDNWVQEKYVSCLNIHTLYERLGSEENAFYYLLDAYNYDTRRIECIYRLVKYYCKKNMNKVANAFYTLIKHYYENEYVNDSDASTTYLFMRKEEYDFYLPYYMIIVSERLKDYDTFAKMYEIIFIQKYRKASNWWISNLYYNIQFGVDHLPKTDEFLQNMISFVKSYDEKIENISHIHSAITKISACV